ncbi:MAG: hypothetical protein PHE51_11440 [Eubacteriales bacterium]|nr:hypothetical protein [Eubacteriales bacterium]
MKPYLYYGDLPSDAVITGTLKDILPSKCGIYQEGNGYRSWDETDDGYILYDYDKHTGTCYMQIRANKEWSKIDISFFDIRKHLNASDDYFAFNALRDIFKYICLKHGGIVLHSSAISFNNNGIVFSAHSGVGKSTHTSLWQEVYGDSIEIINDDTPAIVIENGQAILFGTPFCGTSGINKNKAVPLKAICFIQRSEDNHIERLSSTEAIRRFFEQIKRPVTRELMNDALTMIGKVLEVTPIYLLSCNISHEAVEVVKNELEI